jgi:predicted RNase H-like HicB family nuclease
MKYVVYQEGKYYVSQCLNVDVSSFGKTIDDAVRNLQDALELYYRDSEQKPEYNPIGNALIGETIIHA